ncbi:MAG: 1-deoxy-D-xylulose-5-phosphate reductoisomerase [Bulleidia sp.]|nr:1-deoxy-D-xylulose-5-phosphate reductoisomerase [Erysipelotrichaceae bacterium]MDY2780310.1 1-deoxy-D-xylulose-5-phosphate reductoisomerase [Bulleidia sp.]
MKKRILLLGASGSIGTQTIDIIEQHPEQYELVSFGVGKNIDYARKLLTKYPVSLISVERKEDSEELQKEFPHTRVTYGSAGLVELVTSVNYDLLVNALVGFVGLEPTLKALETKHNVALANKETLVVGGELVNKAALENGCVITPIDSEHSAIAQCLAGNPYKQIKKLIITASGGSFRKKTREELKDVTVEEALSHPNWTMGAKITIDSATMMNKGFEVMEAHYLFDIPYEQIDVLMHDESIIHSMVEYKDGAVMAELGTPDMRIPIQYAISDPENLRSELNLGESLDLAKVATMHFHAPDYNRFPLLKLAYDIGQNPGTNQAVLNASNEVANAAFRNHRIPFLMIEEVVFKTVEAFENKPVTSLKELIEVDQKARKYAEDYIRNKENK